MQLFDRLKKNDDKYNILQQKLISDRERELEAIRKEFEIKFLELKEENPEVINLKKEMNLDSGNDIGKKEMREIYYLVSPEDREEARYQELKIMKAYAEENGLKQKEISKSIQEKFNVSERYSRAYKRIIWSGCDELIEACATCKIGTMEGSYIAKKDIEDQLKDIEELIS